MKYNYKNIHTVQTSDANCGSACIKTILAYYSYNKKMKDIDTETNSSVFGTSISEIYIFFRKLDFDPEVRRLYWKKEQDKLHLLSQFKFPCIAMIETGCEIKHFVVILKNKKNKLIISDPSKYEIFEADYSYLNNVSMIIQLINAKKSSVKQKGNLIKFNKILKIKKKDLLILFGLLVLVSMLNFSNSFILGMLTNFIINNISTNKTAIVPIFIFGIMNLSISISQFVNSVFFVTFIQKIEKTIVTYFFNNVLSKNFYSNLDHGEYITRLNDTVSSLNVVTGNLLSITASVISIIVSSIILSYYNLEFLFTILFTLLIVSIYIYRESIAFKKVQYDVLDKNTKFYSTNIQIFDNLNTINFLDLNGFFSKKIKENFSDSQVASKRLMLFTMSNYLLKSILLLVFSTFFLLKMINLAVSKEINAGEFATIFSTLTIFLTGIQSISGFKNDLEKIRTVLQRLEDIFYEPKKLDNNDKVKVIETILFKNVNINLNNKPILKKINLYLDFSSYNCFMIKGKSGSGKTTLVKTLLQPENIVEGEILINNVSNKKIESSNLYKNMVYVSNKDKLFSGSVHENLELDSDVLKSDIYDACNESCILREILQLPNKFETIFSENNGTFSVGQLQRLVLARALLKKPEVLILDESLSNVDTETQQKIFINLQNKGIKLILITHDNIKNFNSKLIDLNKLL